MPGTYLASEDGLPIKSSNPLPTTTVLTGSNLTDATAMLVSNSQRKITLANAVAVTDTTTRTYDLITHGLLTEDIIRRYNNFKISLVNSHNQAATVTLYTAVLALGTTVPSAGSGKIYEEVGILIASTGRLLLQDKAGGTGASASQKAVPALAGVHSNLMVQVAFAVAPTSGTFTIMVEMD